MVKVLLHLLLVSTVIITHHIITEITTIMFFIVTDLHILLPHCRHPCTLVVEVHLPSYTVLDLPGTMIFPGLCLRFIRQLIA